VGTDPVLHTEQKSALSDAAQPGWHGTHAERAGFGSAPAAQERHEELPGEATEPLAHNTQAVASPDGMEPEVHCEHADTPVESGL
jgi:hypothetical protein